MLLKNLMEDKKLNFNQPILSVRRYSPSVTSHRVESRINNALPVVPRLPPHRSELKSGPIGNPGAVPFQWEQTPGQPKEEIKTQTLNCDRSPIAPKPPPARYPKGNQQDSHQVARSDNKIQAVVSHGSMIDPSLDENPKNFESRKETTEGSKSSDSGDSDEAYVDALDTLSRTESFSLNCSTSGLTGLDELDVKSPGSATRDPKTQDFMMDRFLPAAKAMVSDTPQYAAKKQPLVREQPQQLKKILNQDKPALRYGTSFSKRYSHFYNNKEEEEEEIGDDCDPHGTLAAVCGLLPWSCIKSSVGFLNPVPAMSVRARVPVSPANRIQHRSLSAGSFTETENEYKSDISELNPVAKHQTAELKENKTSLKNENGQLESRNTFTYCDETKYIEIRGFGSHRKGSKTFQELLADEDSPKELDSGGLVEKTVYVDTIHKVDMRSCSPNTQDTGVPGSREDDAKVVTKRVDQILSRVPGSSEDDSEVVTRRVGQIHATDSSLEDFKKLNTVDGEAKLLPNAHKSGDFNSVSSIAKSNRGSGMELPKSFRENQDSHLDLDTTENIEAAEQDAAKNKEKQLPRAVTLGNSHDKYFPVPPPLPNSPSDSWLWRTLPSMSTKNAALCSYLEAATNPQNHGSKAHRGDIKWEAMVKSTKVQRQNLRYAEELLTPIPET